MLGFDRLGVSVMSQLFEDVVGHGEVNVALVVMPLEIDTTISITDAILNDFIGFLSEGIVEVL
jgi:hypothetical protein